MTEETPLPHVLLGLTGSVASLKAPLLTKALSKFAEVQIVATPSSFTFFSEKDLPEGTRVWKDSDEAEYWLETKNKVLHIDLRRWADLFLIAPLSANALSKIVHGLCDDIVTEVVRCWDYNKPLLVAPGMNTLMWTNEPTAEHISAIKKRGIEVISPVSKTLACGDVGMGGMAEVPNMAEIVYNVFLQKGLIKENGTLS